MTDRRDGSIRGKRVLVVTNLLKYAIHHRLHLFRRLVDEGNDVTIAANGTPQEKAQLEALGITVHLCAVVPYRLSPVNDLMLFPVIRRLVRDIRPDVLHLFTLKPILFGKLAVLTLRWSARPTSLILSLTGLGRIFLPGASAVQRVLRSAVLRVMNLPLGGLSQLLTVETRSDRDELSSLSEIEEHSIIVTNGTGVDFDAFSSPQDAEPRCGPVTFLFAGRLLKSKGVLSYLEAAARLAERGVNARFLVAGGCDELDPDCVPARAFEAFWPVPGFEHLGEVSAGKMPGLLRTVDVVCLPTSYKEGIPRVLLESAASGCAFISCRTPGWVETMGETSASGWYVEPRDIDALAIAMQTAAEDPVRTRKAGEAAREMVLRANVSCTDVQERYLDAYERAGRQGFAERRAAAQKTRFEMQVPQTGN